MAQITLPTDESVAKPKASPGEFASPGATVAELGQETEQLALGNQAFEAHLYEAQRYLKYKQIEIQVGKLENEAHDELSKTVTPEDAQAVHAQFKQRVDDALGPYMADKQLARQLHIYGQQADVQMQNIVNGRKATLIQHGDQAANEVIYKNSVQEAVNTAAAGGDPEVALGKLNAKLQSSVHVIGTMLPDQADKIMQKAHIDVDKGIIKAGYNSPDPAKRQETIRQLQDGSSFPNLDDADKNALLVAAEKRNRELSNLSKSENLNVATETFNEQSQGLTYEGKMKLLDSDKWAKDNGYVDENGNVDRKTINELKLEADRQESRDRKIQTDKDNDIISKHAPNVDDPRKTMSDAQIDKMVRDEGGSEKAASTLKTSMHHTVNEARSAYRFGEYVAGAGARNDRRSAKTTGDKESANLFRDISNGAHVDMSQVWDKVDQGSMTTAQALKVQQHIEARKSADYKYDSTKIANATGLDDATKTKLTLDLLDAKTKQNLQGNEMHNFTDKLIKDAGQKQTSSFIDNFFNKVGGAYLPTSAPNAAPSGPTVIETRTTKDGRTLEKLSDGTIRESQGSQP